MRESIATVANRRSDRIAAERVEAIAISHLRVPLKKKIALFMGKFEFESYGAALQAYYRRLRGH